MIVVFFSVLAKYLFDRSSIFTGFAAKNIASGVFVAGRTQESIEAVDVNFFPVNFANTVVDTVNKTVCSDFLGFSKQKAVYREGLGCTLIGEMNPNEVRNQSIEIPFQPKQTFWPQGDIDRDTILSFVDKDKLNLAIQNALNQGNTRSVLVAYDTLIKWEKYAPGFDEKTPLIGWSMSKSITSTMFGIMVKEGVFSVDDYANIEEWKNDERSKITYRHLLNMNSGLQWTEDYGDISEATIMLYDSADIASYAINRPYGKKPGSEWKYSSGTSNILSEIIKRQFDNIEDYWRFPYEEIFHKIGMYNTTFETDVYGMFVGSSYTYATTRDWARYGLLYLQNGIWLGDTIINPEWVKFTQTESPGSDGKYGAHFWLNKSGHEVPDAPKDTYFADGYQGQRIYIIPSKKLIIVRFGVSKKGEFDYNKMLTEIINAFE